MNLSVIYRACGSECNGSIKRFRPDWFSKESCWRNFLSAFPDVDIHVVWDGEFNNLSDLMRVNERVSFHPVNYKNNQQSLLHCYELAESLDSDAFYFVEDDYLHKVNSSKILKEGLEAFAFVTLYDHPDRYSHFSSDVTYGREYMFLSPSTHWRSVESTTCTVAITKRLLAIPDIKDMFIRHCLEGNGAPNDRSLYRELFTKHQIRLFAPVPGYSTHCVETLLSPLVEWETINKITI